MARKNTKNVTEIVDMPREAVEAGNDAWDAVNRFHGKLLQASAAASMLPEIRAHFDHICQGKQQTLHLCLICITQ